jgi:hypothetical protein
MNETKIQSGSTGCFFSLEVQGVSFSFSRAWQLYRIESLHLPAHTVTTGVLRELTKNNLQQ